MAGTTLPVLEGEEQARRELSVKGRARWRLAYQRYNNTCRLIMIWTVMGKHPGEQQTRRASEGQRVSGLQACRSRHTSRNGWHSFVGNAPYACELASLSAASEVQISGRRWW